MLIACGSPLDLRGTLAPMQHEAETLAADMLPDLGAWHVVVEALPGVFVCADELSVGCTALSIAHEQAWIRLAMASQWTLKDSAFVHEVTHVWLAATTGDGDPKHLSPVWQ